MALLSVPSVALAQLPPLEATRAGPHPRAAASGEVMGFVRAFAAARDGDRVLVVYIENDGPRGALRSALFARTVGSDGATTLTRTRDDVTLAPNVRSLSLTWDGRRGAVAFVVPRVAYVPPPSERPRPRVFVRRERVGVPASAADPLGPVVPSGGEVAFVALDGEGAPVGEPRMLFTENSRLWRAAVGAEPEGWVVAWTGAMVTDDEVRGTVRAMRLGADGSPARPMASATSWSGDVGDQLAVTRVGDATAVVFSGGRCVARVGEPAPPTSINVDPSRDIDPPGRRPQPQADPQLAPGPPIACGPTSLHTGVLRADHTLGPFVAGPWLLSDAATIERDIALIPVASNAGAGLARVALTGERFGAITDVTSDAPLTPPSSPSVTPQPTDNLRRPAPDAEVLVRELPIAPPARPTPQTLARFLQSPRAVRGAPSVRGAPVALVTSDRRAVALQRGRDATLLATTELFFYDAAVLPGAGDAHLVLTREGTWSGPLRFFAVGATGPAQPVALPVTLAAAPSARAPRYALRAPYVYDEEFARLFARTRMLRAVFMRHENIAGLLASRPQAPTDPRMPGLLAVRRNHQNRWEVACAALRRRAIVLARAGAGDDVVQGVNQLCEIHGELVLGRPVDPSL
jgi:hypothetical protein